MTIPYQYIELKGSAYERGVTYGQQAKEKILRSLNFYRELFLVQNHLQWETARSFAVSYIPSIKEVYSDGLEEIRGIADGAGVSFEDILTLNCRSEVIYAQPEPDACTAFGCTPELSANQHTWLAQTWDWKQPATETIVVLKITQPPQPTIILFTEAGIIGGKGLNECGIGVTLNALGAGKGQVGVPLHLIYRMILNSTRASQAAECITGTHRAGSGCFNIASAEGFAFSAEFTAHRYGLIFADDKNPICHTNHYLSTGLKGIDEVAPRKQPNTYFRLNSLERSAHKYVGKYDQTVIHQMLSDHHGHPDAVCRHGDEHLPAIARSMTIYAIVMDLDDRCIWFYPGLPCEEKPVVYQI